MNSAILGLYGIYFVLLAYQGNSSNFLDMLVKEKQFVPWIIAIAVLGFLYNQDSTHDFVSPFATLLIVSLIVTRFPTVKKEVSSAYDSLTGTAS